MAQPEIASPVFDIRGTTSDLFQRTVLRATGNVKLDQLADLLAGTSNVSDKQDFDENFFLYVH